MTVVLDPVQIIPMLGGWAAYILGMLVDLKRLFSSWSRRSRYSEVSFSKLLCR